MRFPFSPYPFGEFVSMVGRRFSPPPPRPTSLDRALHLGTRTPDEWLGFVGDICPLFGRRAQFGDGVRDFLSDCEVVVGNFEGIFSDRAWWPFLMKHAPDIFPALAELQPLDRWVLSIANNHATDYGTDGLQRTLRMLEQRDIRWFGTADRPRVSLADDVTVTGWTQWLNRDGHGVARTDPGPPDRPGLHVAFPHWGYEHERTPRPSQSVPDGYDLTAGHHTHLPQPFEQTPDGPLVAWSLGNFVTGKQLPVLGEGAILRVGIARPRHAPPQIVRAHFREISLDRDRDQCRVELRQATAPNVTQLHTAAEPT